MLFEPWPNDSLVGDGWDEGLLGMFSGDGIDVPEHERGPMPPQILLFYENLWEKNMGKLAALREAQIWMLRDKGNRGLAIGDDADKDNEPLPPFYWAAFVLSGDWR